MRHEIVSRYTLEGDDVEKLIRAHLGLLSSDQLKFSYRPKSGMGPTVAIKRDDGDKKTPPKKKLQTTRRVQMGLEVVAEHIHEEVEEGKFSVVSFARSMTIRLALRELERAATLLHKLVGGGDSDAEQIAFIDLQRSINTLMETHGIEPQEVKAG